MSALNAIEEKGAIHLTFQFTQPATLKAGGKQSFNQVRSHPVDHGAEGVTITALEKCSPC